MTPGDIEFGSDSEFSRLTKQVLQQTRKLQSAAYQALLQSPQAAERLEKRLSKRYNAHSNEKPS
jgi:hypothetical protein